MQEKNNIVEEKREKGKGKEKDMAGNLDLNNLPEWLWIFVEGLIMKAKYINDLFKQ